MNDLMTRLFIELPLASPGSTKNIIITQETKKQNCVCLEKYENEIWQFCHSVAMSICLFVCLSVTIQNTHVQRSWRLLIEGRIANIGLQWHICSSFHQLGPLGRVGLVVAMCVSLFLCFWVVPFSCNFFRGLSLVLRWHDQIPASHWSTLLPYHMEVVVGKKHTKKHSTSSNLYLFYYPHRSRELVSPVCGIFFSSGWCR